jgi:hypothetical protein
VESSCEFGIEPSGSMKCWGTIEHIRGSYYDTIILSEDTYVRDHNTTLEFSLMSGQIYNVKIRHYFRNVFNIIRATKCRVQHCP